MKVFACLIKRDLLLALRQGSDSIAVLFFFVVAASLFPFGIGPEPNVLARISSGIVWVTALLAAMLSLDRLFEADYVDGTLEALVLAPTPLELTVLAKSVAHWLTTGLPLMLAAPVLALMLNMDPAGLGLLVFAMALGTPSLSLIGAIGAALTLGARRTGVLISLLVLPLYIPILIFGVGTVDATLTGLSPRPHLMILGALLLVSLALGPLAAAAALRQALE